MMKVSMTKSNASIKYDPKNETTILDNANEKGK